MSGSNDDRGKEIFVILALTSLSIESDCASNGLSAFYAWSTAVILRFPVIIILGIIFVSLVSNILFLIALVSPSF